MADAPRVHELTATRWWQKLTYPRSTGLPLHEIGRTQEAEFPWRIGACHVYRFPHSRHAIALGEWTGQQEITFDESDGAQVLRLRPLEDWQTYVQQED